MSNQIAIDIPDKLKPLFYTKKRFICIVGGRGSAKSWTIALWLVLLAAEIQKRILCAREIQISIKDSVHKLLNDTINRIKYDRYYDVTDKQIRSAIESEFIFKGLWNNINNIKSTEGIDICWVEEANKVSRQSLEVLTPTIRKTGSQIIFSYNPEDENDPVHKDYTLPALRGERDDVEVIQVNYSDNPHFPDELRQEMEYDKKRDYDLYLHKWEGHCVAHSEAQIFYKKWEVKEFEAEKGIEFRYGADFGFATDPTVLIRMFIKENCLYVDYEAYGFKVDINNYPSLFKQIPLSNKFKIVADSARPESISYLNNNGFFVIPAKKGKNSVVEGIERIKYFDKIYVHPRCKNTIDELRFYCYKTDKRTGIISSIPEDKHNHIIDSIRYATEDLIVGHGNINTVTGW